MNFLVISDFSDDVVLNMNSLMIKALNLNFLMMEALNKNFLMMEALNLIFQIFKGLEILNFGSNVQYWTKLDFSDDGGLKSKFYYDRGQNFRIMEVLYLNQLMMEALNLKILMMGSKFQFSDDGGVKSEFSYDIQMR